MDRVVGVYSQDSQYHYDYYYYYSYYYYSYNSFKLSTVSNLVTDPYPFSQHGDLVSLVFVLSAIAPQHHHSVFEKIALNMKPGAILFFRDYGRYDFGELNLSAKGNRKLRDHFYQKGDGVCVYYFLQEELRLLAERVGLVSIRVNYHCKILENRKTGLKMYRVWLQGRFYKPPIAQDLGQWLKRKEDEWTKSSISGSVQVTTEDDQEDNCNEHKPKPNEWQQQQPKPSNTGPILEAVSPPRDIYHEPPPTINALNDQSAIKLQINENPKIE